ncbi:efflux RND transporter periplasmic adaptor subunit [Anaerophaga thermohalophila]|uniref:efflux RND transporter periplasmic adaptor subunit n=1 Tax=Anaerophaga thermohalophila TaxID=177400 RepID=UPI0009E4B5F9|nr:efflux RND transporter periplasmic adaptor subunit [Anaerophaga thermohalophila]
MKLTDTDVKTHDRASQPTEYDRIFQSIKSDCAFQQTESGRRSKRIEDSRSARAEKRVCTSQIVILTALAVLYIGLAGCGNVSRQTVHNESETDDPHEQSGHEAHNHARGSLMAIREELSENQVLVTSTQMKSVDIKLGRPSKEHLSDVIKAFGSIALPPAHESSVSPFIGGVVKDISVIEGDYVHEGDVLAHIEHPDVVDLQKDYLDAFNNHEFLKKEFARQSRLFRDSVNSARTVQKMESEYKNNLTRLQSLKQKLRMINIDPGRVNAENLRGSYPLKAPASGIVTEVMVNNGVPVSGNQELFHIADNEKAHLDMAVYEKDLARIEPGQRMTFNLANGQLPGPFYGTILKKSGRFDEKSRTALVHAEIEDKNDVLLPGMAVVAHIQIGDDEVLALPEEAVVSDQGKEYVFRLIDDHQSDERLRNNDRQDHESLANEHGHEAGEHQHGDVTAHQDHCIFERIVVNSGVSEGGLVEVIFADSAVQNEWFAVENAAALLSEMKKGAAGHHGHAH